MRNRRLSNRAVNEIRLSVLFKTEDALIFAFFPNEVLKATEKCDKINDNSECRKEESYEFKDWCD